MREIHVDKLKEAIAQLCMDANYDIPEDVFQELKKAYEKEESSFGKEVLKEILENDEIARKEKIPICQDCGLAVLFIEVGQDVHFVGGDFNKAVEEGVRKGYKEGYLRKSTCHPLTRKNVGDNTPPIVHIKIVPGDKVKIICAPKGGGSENMSRLKMLKPAEGIEGVKNLVIEAVREGGGNPCPPIIVGVGIGGNFEMSAILAKKALLRPLGSKNPDPEMAKLEEELLEKINKLGVGPMGYGGRVTALGVHVEMMPCHIASFPVAVNIQCHAARHKEIEL
jgi:fumarate hydratase subunit alpha